MRHAYFAGVMVGLLVGCQLTRPSASPDYRAIRQELYRIYQRDQQIREAITAVGMDSPAAVPLFHQMHATDSVKCTCATYWPLRAGRRAAKWATQPRARCTWLCNTRAAT